MVPERLVQEPRVYVPPRCVYKFVSLYSLTASRVCLPGCVHSAFCLHTDAVAPPRSFQKEKSLRDSWVFSEIYFHLPG